MDARVIATLQLSLVGLTCQSAEILHGYPFLRFGEKLTIFHQSSWRLSARDGMPTPDIRVLDGAEPISLEVVGELFDLRLVWDSGFIFVTAPEPDDMLCERWIANIAPMLLAGAGPAESWFSFI